jgi:hypothetical protein
MIGAFNLSFLDFDIEIGLTKYSLLVDVFQGEKQRNIHMYSVHTLEYDHIDKGYMSTHVY